MDKKFYRYCVIESRRRLKIITLFVLIAVIIGQLWYGGVQAKQLDALKTKGDLIAQIKNMEKALKDKAQLQAFRNEGDGKSTADVQFSKISGIAMQGGTPSVLIDGTVYSEGSAFGEYVIMTITSQQITLINTKTDAVKTRYVFE